MEFSVLHDRRTDPVDSGVAADRGVGRVHHDAFEPLERAVFASPVRVEEAEVSASLSRALFRKASQRTSGLDVLDTLVGGLTIHDTLGVGSLSGSSADTDSVDDVSLLGLVTKSSRLVHARRSGASVHGVQLTEFPASEAHDEAHHIGLLLLPEFLEVFVSSLQK